MSQHCDTLFYNAKIATLSPLDAGYGELEFHVLAVSNGKILYLGSEQNCPYKAAKTIDCEGQWLLPGFVDCHTHLVYGGNRSAEFEQRLNGKSYAEIAHQGGGIKSTVNATRATNEEDLLQSAIKRAKCLIKEGVTTIEIKSGYGLDLDTEQKMLRVARRVGESLGINISTTYLGAHATPLEFANNADSYIDYICDTVLPEVAHSGLADSVDVFCESIGFSPAQCARVFDVAKQFDLPIKAHVEQLSDLKGAVLASHYGALSVDHIEYLDEQDIPTLAAANTVAVLLPGAFYYLNETQKPPVNGLREHSVPMAVATDLNPGSSPMASLLLAANMACIQFGLTPVEALKGISCHGARALNLRNKGELKVGNDADLCLWPIGHPNELVYGINQHHPSAVWVGGNCVEIS